MRNALALVPLALAIFASHDVRADILPSGHKAVKLSIRVEAEVPAGQTLLLGRTFRGIDVITPGKATPVEWHPLGGLLQIAAVPASSVMANVEELRQKLDRRPLADLFQKGKPCHDAFRGFRTAPRSAPADVIQWNYKVTFSGDGCKATLVSMEFFDETGKAVSGADIADLPLGVPGVPANSPQTPPEPPDEEPIPAEKPKGACGCEVGPGAADRLEASIVEKWGPWISIAMAGLALGLRRKSNRGSKQ